MLHTNDGIEIRNGDKVIGKIIKTSEIDQATGYDTTDQTQAVAVGQLRSFIERIERLEEEKKTISDDIKDVYAELKGTGFDSKAVRTIIGLRKKEEHERQEEEAMVALYRQALGMC